MILRLAQTVADKLQVDASSDLPLAPDPLMDWSVRLFKVSRVQWVIFVNTSALFSFVLPARGLGTPTQVATSLVILLNRYLENTKHRERSAYQLMQAQQIVCAKTLNRSVTGSITGLVKLAQTWLESGRSIDEVSSFLQDTPMLTMEQCIPHKAFALLLER